MKTPDHRLKPAAKTPRSSRPPGRTGQPRRKPAPLEGRAAYTITEFGNLIGRSRVTIWRNIRAGKIKSVDVLGAKMIPASELQRLNLAPLALGPAP
jgi:hypothetical protein